MADWSICAFEITDEGVHDAQTVEQTDERRRGADSGRKTVYFGDAAAAVHFHAAEARGDALLHATIGDVVEHGLGGFHLFAGGARHAGDEPAVAAERLFAIFKAAGGHKATHRR